MNGKFFEVWFVDSNFEVLETWPFNLPQYDILKLEVRFLRYWVNALLTPRETRHWPSTVIKMTTLARLLGHPVWNKMMMFLKMIAMTIVFPYNLTYRPARRGMEVYICIQCGLGARLFSTNQQESIEHVPLNFVLPILR